MAPQTTVKRTRSWHFVVSGALGGFAGFVLMEVLRQISPAGGTFRGDVLASALYFAGFGLAVGGALGMTEGLVKKDQRRLVYGLVMGLALGAVGGLLGGAVGQTIYSLFPHKYAGSSRADVALVLDSSGSMKQLFFFGNDPSGQRRKAAAKLVDRLSDADRVTIVDFDETARVWLPLTRMDSPASRRAAKQAISRVDSVGGTHLTAGLHAALAALLAQPSGGRDRFVVFLTDGEGEYDPAVLAPAIQASVKIYTVGLGAEIDPRVLEDIATETGGAYYPVARAGDLIAVFDRIFTEHMGAMTEHRASGPEEAQLLTPVWILIFLRVLSWAAVGWLLGLGQGVRENTREDLRACAWGGLFGGALGGALFELAGPQIGLQAGLIGRLLADVTVGAFIGGTMRMAQARMVDKLERPTTPLLSVLPEKSAALSVRGFEAAAPHPQPQPAASPAPRPSESSGNRPSLGELERRHDDRALAMARAYEAGHPLSEIARHFGVSPPAVKRAVDGQGARRRPSGVVLVALWALLGGCVPSGSTIPAEDLHTCNARLDECRQSLQAAREVRRLDREHLPEAIRPEVRDQVEHLLSVSLEDLDLPARAEARAELENQIYAVIQEVAASYEGLELQYEEMTTQYEELTSQNQELRRELEEVGRSIDDLQSDPTPSPATSQQIDDVQTYLRSWMYRHVDCRDCPERLKFKKKQRDALSKLELELTRQLAELRETTAGTPSAAVSGVR